MKRTIAGVALALGLAAGVQAADQAAHVEDVILLAREGLSDETLIAFLQIREIGFTLDAALILRLRDAGVSEEVIRYLLARTPEEATPSPAYLPPVVPNDYYAGYYASSGYYAPSGYSSAYYAPYRRGYVGFSLFPSAWFDHHHHRQMLGHSINLREFHGRNSPGHLGHASPRAAYAPQFAVGHVGGYRRAGAPLGTGHLTVGHSAAGGRAHVLGHGASHASGGHGARAAGHGGHR